MKVAIIDDIRLARQELKRMLRDFPDVEIAGEAANAAQARELVHLKNPDLLLLDIQMPGEDGFELLESLDAVPEVVFTTAYDEYAVKAFEENALDYLMKPIPKERLAKAIGKVREKIDRHPMSIENDRSLGLEDTFFVKDGKKCRFITLREVVCFESIGNYAKIHFGSERTMIHRSLNSLEKRLSPRNFFRANRQVIINLEYVRNVEPWFNGGLRVYLPKDQVFDISRRQAAKLNELLGL